MPRFQSAAAALLWAIECLDVWRAGKGFDPDPCEHRGGSGALGAILMAIDIEHMAIKSCIDGSRCAHQRSPECLIGWYTSSLDIRSAEEEARIKCCAAEFARRLRRVGWID